MCASSRNTRHHQKIKALTIAMPFLSAEVVTAIGEIPAEATLTAAVNANFI